MQGAVPMTRELLVISIEAGLVQDIYTDADVEVHVVDWDTEGATVYDEGVVEIATSDGRKRLAAVHADCETHPLADLHPDLANAVAAQAALP